MRPGTKAWSAAIWLLLIVNAPILCIGLLVDNDTVETLGLSLAVVALAANLLHRRALRTQRGVQR